MKKLLVFLLSLSLVVSLAACGGGKQTSEEEPPSVVASTFPPGDLVPLQLNITTTTKTNWPTGNPKPLSTMSYQQIQLADSKAFPGLSGVLGDLNADISDKAISIYKAGGNVAGEGDGDDPMAGNPNGKEISYASVIDVRRSDNAVVSLLVDEIHGVDTTKTESCACYTYYADDGSQINLSDVAVNQEDVLKTAAGYFANKYPTLDEQTLIGQFSQNVPAWTLDYQGVSFYLSKPSGMGLMTVMIPFTTELFSADFTKTPAQYAIPFSANVPVNFVDANGAVKTLSVSHMMADDWATSSLDVSWGGKTTSFPFASYSANFTLIHVGTGKDYLYAGGVEDGDYPFVQVFSLAGDVPVLRSTINGVKCHQTSDESGAVAMSLITDPTNIALDSYVEEGANPVTGYYSMDGDGTLKDKTGTIISGLTLPKEVG